MKIGKIQANIYKNNLNITKINQSKPIEFCGIPLNPAEKTKLQQEMTSYAKDLANYLTLKASTNDIRTKKILQNKINDCGTYMDELQYTVLNGKQF